MIVVDPRGVVIVEGGDLVERLAATGAGVSIADAANAADVVEEGAASTGLVIVERRIAATHAS